MQLRSYKSVVIIRVTLAQLGLSLPWSYQSVDMYRVPPLPRLGFVAHYLPCSCAHVGLCALEVTKVSLLIVCPPPLSQCRCVSCSPPAQQGLCALEVTKVSLFIVFPTLPTSGFAPSMLPECRYSLCSHPCSGGALRPRSCHVLVFLLFPPCPGGALRPRSCQSVATHRVPTLGRAFGPRSYHFIAIYCVTPPCLGGVWPLRSSQSVAIYRLPLCVCLCALEVTEELLFIVLSLLSRWAFASPKLLKGHSSSCSPTLPPCPGGALRPRIYQRVAVYRVSPLDPVGLCALEVIKVSLFSKQPSSKLIKLCWTLRELVFRFDGAILFTSPKTKFTGWRHFGPYN